MSNIDERVTQCFRNVFPALRPDEIRNASTSSLGAWDSVAQVTLLSSIGEEFGIEPDMDDYDTLISFALIVAYLKQRLPG